MTAHALASRENRQGITPFNCAVIEGHRWPQVGDANASIDGWRHYAISPRAAIDIIDPWTKPAKAYHLFLINDELGCSNLPSYIPYQQRVALIKESPNLVGQADTRLLARQFPLVLTHLKDHIDKGPPFRMLPYSSNHLGLEPSLTPWSLPPLRAKNRLCSFIGNLNHNPQHAGYQLRREVYEALCDDSRVDCFGRDTNPIANKAQALHRYAFSIAMENASKDYYFTEKLIDCFLMGTIPIYWGCPSIGDFFDNRGILSFRSMSELQAILSSLSWPLYTAMYAHAATNFHRLIQHKMADFRGYLERALQQISLCPSVHDNPAPYQLSYGTADRLLAAWRRYRAA